MGYGSWDGAHIKLMRSGAVSRRAGYRIDSTSIDGKRLHRDEGGHGGGFIPHDEVLDHPKLQGGSATYGRRVSKGGGAGREFSPGGTRHIDTQNRRIWPRDAAVRAGNRNSTPRGGEAWALKHAPRATARRWTDSEYYPNEQGWLSGDPAYRQR